MSKHKEYILAAKKGCLKSKEFLLKEYYPCAYKFGLKLIRANQHLKEDLEQELYIAILDAIKKFDYKKSNCLSTFLYWTCKSRLTQYIQTNEGPWALPINTNGVPYWEIRKNKQAISNNYFTGEIEVDYNEFSVSKEDAKKAIMFLGYMRLNVEDVKEEAYNWSQIDSYITMQRILNELKHDGFDDLVEDMTKVTHNPNEFNCQELGKLEGCTGANINLRYHRAVKKVRSMYEAQTINR